MIDKDMLTMMDQYKLARWQGGCFFGYMEMYGNARCKEIILDYIMVKEHHAKSMELISKTVDGMKSAKDDFDETVKILQGCLPKLKEWRDKSRKTSTIVLENTIHSFFNETMNAKQKSWTNQADKPPTEEEEVTKLVDEGKRYHELYKLGCSTDGLQKKNSAWSGISDALKAALDKFADIAKKQVLTQHLKTVKGEDFWDLKDDAKYKATKAVIDDSIRSLDADDLKSCADVVAALLRTLVDAFLVEEWDQALMEPRLDTAKCLTNCLDDADGARLGMQDWNRGFVLLSEAMNFEASYNSYLEQGKTAAQRVLAMNKSPEQLELLKAKSKVLRDKESNAPFIDSEKQVIAQQFVKMDATEREDGLLFWREKKSLCDELLASPYKDNSTITLDAIKLGMETGDAWCPPDEKKGALAYKPFMARSKKTILKIEGVWLKIKKEEYRAALKVERLLRKRIAFDIEESDQKWIKDAETVLFKLELTYYEFMVNLTFIKKGGDAEALEAQLLLEKNAAPAKVREKLNPTLQGFVDLAVQGMPFDK